MGIEILDDIEYYRGDTEPLDFILYNGDTDTPIEITFETFIFTVTSVKNPTDNTTLEFQLAGVVNVDQVTYPGWVSFYPSESNTDLLPGKHYYDVQMMDVNGKKITLIKKTFTILQDRTKV